MLHWRLMSTLARGLLLAGAVGLVADVVFLLAGGRLSFFSGVVVAVLVAALFVRRRDLNAAIAVQLRLEDEEARERDRLD
jgi:hypothetical protein